MKKSLILNFLFKIGSMFLSFVYIPQALKFLGETDYGIWATLLSILNWISFCDIGIGNSLRINLVQYIEKKNNKKIKELISTSYFSILKIMLLILILLILILIIGDIQILLNIKYSKLKELFILTLFFVIINFILSLSKSIYYAQQKSEIVSMFDFSIQFLNYIGVLILNYKHIDSNLILICLIYGISIIIVNIAFTLKLWYESKIYIPNYKYNNNNLRKKMNKIGYKFFFLQISLIIVYSTDNILITKLYGANYVTSYNISMKIFGAVSSIYGIITMTFWSKITKEYISNNIQYIKKILKRLELLSVICIPGVIFLIYIFPAVSKIWLNEDIYYPKYLILYIGIYTILNIWCDSHIPIMNGLGFINLQILLAIINIIINIPLSIYFAKYLDYGVSGIILATIVSRGIAAVCYPLYSYKKLNGEKNENNNTEWENI